MTKINNKIMMMLCCILTFVAGVNAQKQIEITEGGMGYTEVKRKTNSAGKEIREELLHKIEFSPTQLKNNYHPRKGVSITTVSDLITHQAKTFANNGQKFYMMKETYNPIIFDLGLYNENKPFIELMPDTMLIKDHKCKKALYHYDLNGQSKIIVVWYSPDFKIKVNVEVAYFFEGIDGVPVNFSFMEQSKFDFGSKGNPTYCEYIIDTLYQTKNDLIKEIDNKEKYEMVSEEEKFSKLAEVVIPPSRINSVQPKGQVITEQVINRNGITLNINKYNPFKIGEKLADFKMIDYEGVQRSLTSYGSTVKVINFWFTSCAPCIKEMPLLNQVRQNNKGKDITFLSITYNSKKEVATFLKKHTYDFEKITDASKLTDQYGLFTYPITVVLDKDNIIRAIQLGAFESESSLQTIINEVLDQ